MRALEFLFSKELMSSITLSRTGGAAGAVLSQQLEGRPMRQWTQDEAIAFECAREAITDLMAIQTGQIAQEGSKAAPDADRLASLRAERSRLAQERTALHLDDLGAVARIRSEYGAIVRAWREAMGQERRDLEKSA
jgi:hypothetical protein